MVRDRENTRFDEESGVKNGKRTQAAQLKRVQTKLDSIQGTKSTPGGFVEYRTPTTKQFLTYVIFKKTARIIIALHDDQLHQHKR